MKTVNLKIENPHSFGVFYRNASEDHLILHTAEKTSLEKGISHYNDKNYPRFQNLPEIGRKIQEKAMEGRSLAFQDYYEWWFKNRSDKNCGKLLLLDRKNPDVHQIFFDDNLHFKEYAITGKLIVDTRDFGEISQFLKR